MTWHQVRTWPNPEMQRQAEWCGRMLDASVKTAGEIGCSPAAIVAQAALEGGWGQNTIGNNTFGIKAGSSWTGMKRLVWTREVIGGQSVMEQDWFRDYPTLADGIEDHFAFLRDNGRYRAAGVFDIDNSKSDQDYFNALAAAGYATDPNYAQILGAMLASVHYYMAGMIDDANHVDTTPMPSPPLLYLGCPDGPAVAALQKALAVPESGHYDFTLKGLVMAYQSAHPACGGVDGIVGKKTRAALGI